MLVCEQDDDGGGHVNGLRHPDPGWLLGHRSVPPVAGAEQVRDEHRDNRQEDDAHDRILSHHPVSSVKPHGRDGRATGGATGRAATAAREGA